MASKSMRKACYARNSTAIRWIRETVKYSQFDAKDTTDYVDLSVAVPADCFVLGSAILLKQAFAAPTATAATLSVGIEGDTDKYCAAAQDVKGGTPPLQEGAVCADTGIKYCSAGDTPRVTLALTGDNCEDLTAGEAEVRIFFIPAE